MIDFQDSLPWEDGCLWNTLSLKRDQLWVNSVSAKGDVYITLSLKQALDTPKKQFIEHWEKRNG
jgi:hypothetical protein